MGDFQIRRTTRYGGFYFSKHHPQSEKSTERDAGERDRRAGDWSRYRRSEDGEQASAAGGIRTILKGKINIVQNFELCKQNNWKGNGLAVGGIWTV